MTRSSMESLGTKGAFEKHLFLCAKHTGAWLIMWGTTVTGKVMATTEFSNGSFSLQR